MFAKASQSAHAAPNGVAADPPCHRHHHRDDDPFPVTLCLIPSTKPSLAPASPPSPSQVLLTARHAQTPLHRGCAGSASPVEVGV
jgi:hypothetical protein